MEGGRREGREGMRRHINHEQVGVGGGGGQRGKGGRGWTSMKHEQVGSLGGWGWKGGRVKMYKTEYARLVKGWL